MTKFDDLISRTNSIYVLKRVGENPGIGQREIIDGDGRNSKLRRLNEFVDAGLIIERTLSAGRTLKQYHLSEKGERFLKMYLEFEERESNASGIHGLGEKNWFGAETHRLFGR